MPTEALTEVGPSKEIELFLQRLYTTVDEMFAKIADTSVMRGIGMGVPNGNYYKGTVEMPPNLNWNEVVPLASILQKQYGVPGCFNQ
jgi:glucokinase